MNKCLLSAAVALACLLPLSAQDSRRQIDPDDAYKNNCMRCHTSTPQYSPRMTKTIVEHMRVRANLTQEEAQAILRYLTEDDSEPRAKKEKQSPVTSRTRTVANKNTGNAEGYKGND
jgi:hypothetical protein